MKTAGIIGGIAPETTIAYYRGIVNAYLEMSGGKDYPQIVINSINMTEMMGYLADGNLDGLTEYLLRQIEKLVSAGADFGLLASNTPHIVFDRLNEKSPIPLLSIVETTCRKVMSANVKQVGLFGTKSTMQSSFYKDVFAREDIEMVTPTEDEQNYIHKIYFGELVKAIVLPETKACLFEIIDRMKQQDGIEGLVLGGTELSLMFDESDNDRVLIFDTTKAHIAGVMEWMG